jgi:hypothetical protein
MSPNTGDNSDLKGIAAAINSRLEADARLTSAMAFGWLCGGAAIAFTLSGIGLAAALYGYSHLFSVQPAADQAAKALVAALQNTELKTTVSGTMSLSPDSELKLASGQSVKLDERAIVKLDPNSSVRVVGDLKVDFPHPSQEQLQLETKSKNDELPFTSYTIFKNVAFGSGRVVSGWKFDLADNRPKFQYCYYVENIAKGVSRNVTIALNGSPRPPSTAAKLSFNIEGAVTNCIWYAGL